MTNPTPLTDAELKALAYFAVGVSSEGSNGGRDVAYRLEFAGNVQRDGRMSPVANSGYSFGTLQIDLGQHPDVARDFLDNYQRWAAGQADSRGLQLSQAGFAATLTSLQRTGNQMRADGAHDIDRSRLNRFLASDAGQNFVHGLDSEHVAGVTAVDTVRGNEDTALERLQRSSLYRNAADDEQAKLAGLFMKLQNQSGERFWPGIARSIEQGSLTSAAEVKTSINGLLRNQADGDPDYIQSGADNTLRGTRVFSALRGASAENPLSTAWGSVVANPLIGPVAAHRPTQANPSLGIQYDAVRSLFLSAEGAERMIHALDRGRSLAEGNPQPQNGRRQAGFYVAGNDFVLWNRNGEGQACIDGQWRRIDPDDLQRVRNNDGTVDLRLTENGQARTLLHVDPRAPVLRAAVNEAAVDGPTRDTAQADSTGFLDRYLATVAEGGDNQRLRAVTDLSDAREMREAWLQTGRDAARDAAENELATLAGRQRQAAEVEERTPLSPSA